MISIDVLNVKDTSAMFATAGYKPDMINASCGGERSVSIRSIADEYGILGDHRFEDTVNGWCLKVFEHGIGGCTRTVT